MTKKNNEHQANDSIKISIRVNIKIFEENLNKLPTFLVGCSGWLSVLCMNVYAISSVLSISVKISGEILHIIEISVLQLCQ